MSAILEYLKKFPLEEAVTTILLLGVCLIATKVILAFYDKFTKRTTMDALVGKILRSLIKALLLFTVVVICLSSFGISVSSLVATLSVVGVALSLAIQGFLSNVFGGIQVVSNHPFDVGDYVEAGGEAGSVREVGFFYTKLDTPDMKLIQIPNSKIANESIVNYSSEPKRRIEFLVATSYDDDVEKVKSVLLELLNGHSLVLQEEGIEPVAHVKEYRDNDILYTARVWCKNENYWTIYFDIMDAIKPTFEKNGIAFSYPHVNVHMVTGE